MRRWRCAAILCLASLVLAAGDAAAQCVSNETLAIPLEATTFYYDQRSEVWCVSPIFACPSGGPWIYEEGNGATGLQRGGMHWTTAYTGIGIPGEADPCTDAAMPDKLWV